MDNKEIRARIRAWQYQHTQHTTMSNHDLEKILEIDTFEDLDLSHTSLPRFRAPGHSFKGTSFNHASLWNAYLPYTLLTEVDLRGADLRFATLNHSPMTGAKFDRETNFSGASVGGSPILTISGMPSGQLSLWPLYNDPVPWWVRIGCWSGSVEELEELIINPYIEWPYATGIERQRRVPVLTAAHAMIQTHRGYWGDNPLHHTITPRDDGLSLPVAHVDTSGNTALQSET